MYREILFLAVFVSSFWINGLCIQCIDNDGGLVDWYIVYKVPILSNSENTNIRSGKGYYYMDEHNKNFTLQTKAIDYDNTSLANTLKPIYKNLTQDYVMYNDHMVPSKTSGHLKGVIAKANLTGFLLLHSVPNFPPSGCNNYSWPSSGYIYGQILLCVSFQSSQYDNIDRHIWKSNPYPYDESTTTTLLKKRCLDETFLNSTQKRFTSPTLLRKRYPALTKTSLNSTGQSKFNQSKSPGNSTVMKLNVTNVDKINIKSLKKRLFVGYSKPRPIGNAAGIDIYEYLAGEFRENIRVQSWQNGNGVKLNSSCGQYKVENIVEIGIKSTGFPSSKDHSKWAKTVNVTRPIVCIGSLNRMRSQLKRGGNTICFEDIDVWHSFDAIEHRYTPC